MVFGGIADFSPSPSHVLDHGARARPDCLPSPFDQYMRFFLLFLSLSFGASGARCQGDLAFLPTLNLELYFFLLIFSPSEYSLMPFFSPIILAGSSRSPPFKGLLAH